MTGSRPALVPGGNEDPPSYRAGPAPPGSRERVLGRITGPRDGPTLICVAALHGNEPAGVLALERVLPKVEERREHVSGELIALLGNRGALAASQRFIDRDLNRAWSPSRLQGLRSPEARRAAHEDQEQLELVVQIEEAVRRARGPVVLVDFHTTSGSGGAFSTVSDRLANRKLALNLPVPLILGLEEQLDGTLTDWFDAQGYVAIGFESGQHDEPKAVDRAEAALWLAFAAVGILPPDTLPETAAASEALREEFEHLPSVFEVRYRHAVTPESRFVMGAGYRNFQPIRGGEIVGEDLRGPVRAPEPGRVLMPLYQDQGEDGFFVVRAFNPAWLWLSERMRLMRFGRIVHWLPGISRSHDRPDALFVNRRVARWYALELLHLLGYRKHREGNTRLIMVRRTPRNGEP